MKITLIETKKDGDSTLCIWENESAQRFTVHQYETTNSDFEDFSYLYAHRAEFKSLSNSELESLYNALEIIDESDLDNPHVQLKNYKSNQN